MFFRKKQVPLTNETKEIDVVELWSVRWTRRYGSYHGDTEYAAEFFTDKRLAEEFRNSLMNAFKLVQNTADNKVRLQREN